uniref:F-box family protein n=1 Tax=Pithovirus LCPAC406 TaxID=2506599 RepID=A0A481ZDZ9_9VIRU|nr:MAG: F-box family protein [Pithovirus LCPAC406]
MWRDKLLNDYGFKGKSRNTWRETAKVVFRNSEIFWTSIDGNIDYYMTNGIDYSGTSQLEKDAGNKVETLINEFERNLVDHALREREEFYVTELIFKSFYRTDRYIDSIENDCYYINFIPLFEKIIEGSARSISSRGKLSSLIYSSTERKISLQWILSLNYHKEVKITDISIDRLSEEECAVEWFRLNRDLYLSIASLASLYKNYRNLFVDDTTDDQKVVMLMLDKWELHWN